MANEFYVIKNGKGLIVQSWTFAYAPNVIYCKNPDWSMKFDSFEKAKNRLNYFIKNKFKNIYGMMVVKIQNNNFYKEIH